MVRVKTSSPPPDGRRAAVMDEEEPAMPAQLTMTNEAIRGRRLEPVVRHPAGGGDNQRKPEPGADEHPGDKCHQGGDELGVHD